MLRTVLDHPLLVTLVGAALAVTGGGLVAAAGVPIQYALVVGLAVASPAMNLGGFGNTFDYDEYLDRSSQRDLAVDAGIAVLGALVPGLAVTLVLEVVALPPDGIELILTIAVTLVGGNLAFFVRNRTYFDLDRRPPEDAAEESGK